MPRTAVPVRWAVQEVVRIRAESGCLRPGEDVAGQRSVFLVVVRAKRGRRHRTVALATSGSEPASGVALPRQWAPIRNCMVRNSSPRHLLYKIGSPRSNPAGG